MEAQQDRSRATAQRLLSATIRLIAEGGLENATVPKIAELAEVAPASVYRRYPHKDALIRAAFLHALEQSNQNNRQRLKGVLLKENIGATARQLMKMLFDQYRQHPLLLRSLSRYIDTTDDREFVKRAKASIAANAEAVVAVLLHHCDEIVRERPEFHLRFALFHAICAIEAFALDANSLWHEYADFSRDRVSAELAHSFVAYLVPRRQPTRSRRKVANK